MNINRNNFEEFCLLYLDGELSQAEHQELEAFVAANPDLAVELDLLRQLKLKPEAEAPVFFDKTSLFRSSAMENEAIHSGNYETYFLLYTDNELDPEGRKSVEKFVMDHPECQKEFSLLQVSRLVAEPVAFPDKSLLYRKTAQPARVAIMRYWRVAAAAAVILGGIWLGLNTQQRNASVDPAIANVQADNKTRRNETAKENKAPDSQNAVAQKNTSEPAVENAGVNESVKQAPATALAVNKNRTIKQEVKSTQQETKIEQKESPEEPEVAVNLPRSNDLPTERNTTLEQSASSTETASNLGTRSNPEADVIDRPKGGPNAESVKNNFASEALLNASESNVYVVNTAQVEDDHKSPLRGVFRKASRLLNKVTNPEIFKPTSKQNK